jgi:hypothetical protein
VNLPDDCELTYAVYSEAWYAKALTACTPSITIMASHRGGGAAWEFDVEEHDLGKPALRLRMFSDSWDAFAQIPAFFTALCVDGPCTLVDLREILARLGARDTTQRKHGVQP